MSLGGIAIAVGAMVDAAIVMISKCAQTAWRRDHQHPGEQIDNATPLEGDYRLRGSGTRVVHYR